MFRIGCDVGGTNTDAAILDVTRLQDPSRGVLATCKTPTTADVTSGIELAIENVLKQSGIDRHKVSNVAIGTTHFVNAVVEGDARYLSRVACVRLCGPYTREVGYNCDTTTDVCGRTWYRTLTSMCLRSRHLQIVLGHCAVSSRVLYTTWTADLRSMAARSHRSTSSRSRKRHRRSQRLESRQ